jgi:Fur family transcriptional regulator, ferric uptake regulator
MSEPSESTIEIPIDLPKIVEPLCAVFRRTLRAEGQKYTPERAHVLDAIVREEGLFHAEGIIESVKRSGMEVSKATVYRTIKLMLEAGMIQRVPLDEEPARYILSYGDRAANLIIHLDTKRVEVIDSPELAALCARWASDRGVSLQAHSLQVFVSA